MRVSSKLLVANVVTLATAWATLSVRCEDGRVLLRDASGRTTALTETGLDSDPWLSFDERTVLFLRRSADNVFLTSVYEVDLPNPRPRLLYGGPARYDGRESSYFSRPELSQSRDLLFLLSKEYATEGSLISVELRTGEARLISDHVVGYDVVACSAYQGELVALKRQLDILGHPFHLYWLYSPSGQELGLAGDDSLSIDLLREGKCPLDGPEPSTTPPPHENPADRNRTRVDGSVMERQLVNRVEPKYPAQARAEHIQGDVCLLVRVAADGAVEDVDFLSGYPRLAQGAVEAVKQWKYRPTISAGRTQTITLPDGVSQTQYNYQGNLTTVTDPAGNWKLYASDTFGNLVTVQEPDPTANPVLGPPSSPPAYPVPIPTSANGYLYTSYTYDQFNHLLLVSMPRNTANGMYAQTRTFVYQSTSYSPHVNLPALWLTSATNPESHTVSYTYNPDGTLLTKTDANGNTVTYGYDQYQRLTSISNPLQTFAYDNCPAVAPGCLPAPGQLVEAQFSSGTGPNDLSFAYTYEYTPAGNVASKSLFLQSANHLYNGTPTSAVLTAGYSYDSQGALMSVTYPPSANPPTGGTQVFTYTLDAWNAPRP